MFNRWQEIKYARIKVFLNLEIEIWELIDVRGREDEFPDGEGEK